MKPLPQHAPEFMRRLMRLLRWRVWIAEKLHFTEWQTTLLWAALVIARCLQSTVMAGTMPAASAYVSDITTPATRTVGIARLGAANSIGTIIGPAIGGLLAGISLLAPLYFAALVTFACLLLIAFRLPESPRPPVTGATRTQSYSPRR